MRAEVEAWLAGHADELARRAALAAYCGLS